MTRSTRRFAALTLTLVLALGLPCGVLAAQPDKIQTAYDVNIDSSGGVDVVFALALSEVPNYPVSITAISGSTEELLWEGSLSDGVYRLRAQLTKIGPGTVKVVLRTRVTNRSEKGNESYTRYVSWEGTYSR
jgi:hypothetical protein